MRTGETATGGEKSVRGTIEEDTVGEVFPTALLPFLRRW